MRLTHCGRRSRRCGRGWRCARDAVPAGAVTRLFNMLRLYAERTGDEDALTEAIAIARQLVAVAAPGTPRAGPLSNLSVVLRLQFEFADDPGVLGEAVATGRAAAAAAADDDRLLSSVLSNLGNTLRSGYERAGGEDRLAESLDVLRRAVALAPSGHPDRQQVLANADRVLELSYEHTKEAALLAEWERVRREWLAARPAAEAIPGTDLASLAEISRKRFEVTGEIAALDDVVATMRAALAATPADAAERGAIAVNLGIALRRRHRAEADEATIAEAARVLRAAVAATPPVDPGREPALTNLVRALMALYETAGDPSVLEEAIAAGTELAANRPGPAADALLADSLAARYESGGDEEDLRRSLELSGGPGPAAAPAEREADSSAGPFADLPPWAVGPVTRVIAWMDAYESRADVAALDRGIATWDRLLRHPWFATLAADSRTAVHGRSAAAHLHRYAERGDGADLEEALRRCASSLESRDHPEYQGFLRNLALALLHKYERDGDMDDLARAADLGQRVARMTPAGSGARADALTNLGGIWRRLREANGDDAYLDAEVAAWEEAARIPEGDAVKHAVRLNNASVGLHNRYDARGDEKDLQRSIDYSRQAVAAAPPGHRDAYGWQANLGNTLRHRYERTGVIADLDDAIEVADRAVATAPAEWRGRRECLSNLGSALQARARLNQSSELYYRSLQAAQQAVGLTPPTSVEYPLHAANLAVSLGQVAKATGDVEHVNAEIALYTELLDRIPENATRRPWLQTNLATALFNRPGTREDPSAMDRVRVLIRAAVARTAPGTAAFATRTDLLARVLAAAGSHGPQAEEASRAFRAATVTALDIAPAQALDTAVDWARWCEDRQAWPTAVEAYRLAAAAVDRLFATQVGREDKETWLRAANGVPAQAAFALIRAGLPVDAALALERGRVRLLTEALGRNSAALDRLAELGAGALAERFRVAQRRLGALEAGEASEARDGPAADRMRGDDLASALAEHRAALAAIRQLPGYERFLRPPSRPTWPGRPRTRWCTWPRPGWAAPLSW